MSMTREEAIINLEKLIALYYTASEQSKMVDYSKIIETLEFAAVSLRTPTREQVEKVWRGYLQYHGATGTDNLAVVKCSRCGAKIYEITVDLSERKFCLCCGAPLTDEAVEIVMERINKMEEQP